MSSVRNKRDILVLDPVLYNHSVILSAAKDPGAETLNPFVDTGYIHLVSEYHFLNRWYEIREEWPPSPPAPESELDFSPTEKISPLAELVADPIVAPAAESVTETVTEPVTAPSISFNAHIIESLKRFSLHIKKVELPELDSLPTEKMPPPAESVADLVVEPVIESAVDPVADTVRESVAATGVFFNARIIEYLKHFPLHLEKMGSPEFVEFLEKGEGQLIIGCLTESFSDILLRADERGFIYNIHQAMKRLGRRPENTMFVLALDHFDQTYSHWCVTHGEEPVMRGVHFPYFERDIFLRTPREDHHYLTTATDSKDVDKIFVVLCARLHVHRLAFFYEALRRNWLEHCVFSCLNRDGLASGPLPEGEILSFTEHFSKTHWKQLLTFINNAPHLLDEPVSWNYHDNKIPSRAIRRGGVHIVLESDMEPGMTFITEKTYKAILAAQPFLIFGNPGTLKVLREKGYETFPELFDESYDEIPRMMTRFQAVIAQMARWKKLSAAQRHERLTSVALQQKLKRNQERLLQMNSKLEMYKALGINSNEPMEAKYLF